MRVLLTGARAPVTLDLARRFHAAGDEVLVCDTCSCPLARFSSRVTTYLRLPPPRGSSKGYVAALGDAAEQHRVDLIVPTCEEIFHIAMHRELLSCPVLCDKPEKLIELHDKWSFSQTAAGGHVSMPPTRRLTSADELGSILDDVERLVLKPVFGQFHDRVMISPPRWRAEQLRPTTADPWLAQQRIEGRELSTYSVCSRGQVLAHACYEPVYRAGPGAGIYFQAIEMPAAESFVRELVQQRRFTGQIGIDMIEDDEGRLWALEANPRATSGLHLFADSDPLVDALKRAALAGAPAEPSLSLHPAAGQPPAMVGWAMPLWGLASALRGGRLTKLPRDCFRGRDVILDWSDPAPALAGVLSLVELISVSWRIGRPLNVAATHDIQWDGP